MAANVAGVVSKPLSPEVLLLLQENINCTRRLLFFIPYIDQKSKCDWSDQVLLNRQRAFEYMRSCRLDALIASTPTNITYLSDYYCWFDHLCKHYMLVPGGSSRLAMECFAVLPLEGDPALIINPIFAVNGIDLWVQNIQSFRTPNISEFVNSRTYSPDIRRILDSVFLCDGHSTAMDALVAVLKKSGLAGSRVGLEMETLNPETLDALRRAMPHAAILDCSKLIHIIRMVKSNEELTVLRRAAEISDTAAKDALSLARPGLPIAELIQHYRSKVAHMGADFDHFAFGYKGIGIATHPEYFLTKGEVLYIDFGCTYRSYFSDAGTTLAMDDPPTELKNKHDALQDCFAAGRAALRPGVKSSSVQAVMLEVLAARGVHASFPHGHGLGLEIRDYPILVPDSKLRIRDECIEISSDLPLEAGMVINLEAAFFSPLTGSLQVERSLVVTENGNAALIEQNWETMFRPF